VLESDPELQNVRKYVENWGGRASVDSVGYRIVRRFHDLLAEEIISGILSPRIKEDFLGDYAMLQDREASLWRLVEKQPKHFLMPNYPSWQERFLSAIDKVVLELTSDGSDLAESTWGAFNTVESHHPLSLAFPFARRLLDMSPHQLPGDIFMPRVQTPTEGASERFVVSPGREERGFCHMPCGQSGHPFSPHYRDGHSAWVNGEPTPFLPGPTVHTLILVPLNSNEQGR
jgi:penicillin amidase